MKYGKIIMKENEYDLLLTILEKAYNKDEVSVECYKKLNRELKTAECPPAPEFPMDVVTFGSVVEVDTPYGTMSGYRLVAPGEQNTSEKKVSVLSPMGSAIIGYAEGDEVVWNFPAGLKKIKIMKVENEI
ncbi:MAG: GreA/GreB family elongation factor [Bacteroidetes bacterium]|nr:GreA/GreB family elongation factor [Bacteroidota bacterium]